MPESTEAGGWRENRWFWGAVIFMAALFAASSIPDEVHSDHRILLLPPQIHNLLHIPAYAVLTGLWWMAWRQRGRGAVGAWTRAALWAVGFGAVDEIHQYFVPGRYMSITDMLLNAAGALLMVGVLLLGWRRPSR